MDAENKTYRGTILLQNANHLVRYSPTTFFIGLEENHLNLHLMVYVRLVGIGCTIRVTQCSNHMSCPWRLPILSCLSLLRVFFFFSPVLSHL